MKRNGTAILHYSAPPVIGGVEHVIQAHATIFAQAGYPVTVIAGQGGKSDLSPDTGLMVIPEMDSQHSDIKEITESLEQGRLHRNYHSLVERLSRQLTESLGSYRNVIVHNIFTKHFNLPLTDALYSLLDAGVIQNCIAWCHDITWTSPSSRSKVHPGHPWDLLRTYRPDVTYVAVSQQRRRELVELYDCPPESVQTIYNGIDPKSLLGLSDLGYDLISRLGLLQSDLTMIMPVRVTRAKNIEFALQVVAALKAEGIAVKLIVTGPPDPHDPHSMAYYNSLLNLRHQLGVDDEMRFVFESGPDPDQPFMVEMPVVGDLLRVSDLMFMPSHREGFGMPVLEAGLIGIPVICTRVPAAVEIGGVDVLQFDATDSPESVARLIQDWSNMSPAHSFRRRIRQNYTWDQIFQRDIRPLLDQRRDDT